MQVGHLREKRLVLYFISYALPVSMSVDLVLWVREWLQRPQKPSHSGPYWPCQKLGEGQRGFLLRVWPPPEPAPWEVQMGPKHLHIKCIKEESWEHWWSCPLWSQEQCPSQFFFVSVSFVSFSDFSGFNWPFYMILFSLLSYHSNYTLNFFFIGYLKVCNICITIYTTNKSSLLNNTVLFPR